MMEVVTQQEVWVVPYVLCRECGAPSNQVQGWPPFSICQWLGEALGLGPAHEGERA